MTCRLRYTPIKTVCEFVKALSLSHTQRHKTKPLVTNFLLCKTSHYLYITWYNGMHMNPCSANGDEEKRKQRQTQPSQWRNPKINFTAPTGNEKRLVICCVLLLRLGNSGKKIQRLCIANATESTGRFTFKIRRMSAAHPHWWPTKVNHFRGDEKGRFTWLGKLLIYITCVNK